MAQSELKDFLFVLVMVVDQIQGGFHTPLSLQQKITTAAAS